MSERFSVGDVCIVVSADLNTNRIGEECVITSLVSCGGFLCEGECQIKFADGVEGCIRFARLRKRKPPAKTATWEQIERLTNWRPIRETV